MKNTNLNQNVNEIDIVRTGCSRKGIQCVIKPKL
jgi:hypothetical protein